jgi:putative hydrolase
MNTLTAKPRKEVLPLNNAQLAMRLQEVADLLEAQGANAFRVRAYRSAAQTLRSCSRPAHEILQAEGVDGLMRFEGIGHSLARSIEQLTNTGSLRLLERLRGEPAEHLIATVPDIGPKLASRIHEKLGIETLEELEASAYDGRLASLPGMGRKRIRAVCESLAGRFRRHPRIPETHRPLALSAPPSVAELLDIDAEYRQKVRAGALPRIAPRRFNPTGEAWLPVLHTERGARHYTALYSNTARAHELGTTHDWVVIYRDDRGGDGQWTVVTSQYGELRHRRIVRGREDECLAFYTRRATEDEQGTSDTEAERQLKLCYSERVRQA